MRTTIDSAAVREWAAVAEDLMGAHRAEIDALNVFPVPDGDTGTNLFLTVESATAAVERVVEENPDASLADVINAFAQGALLGARGNSGVITSQLLRGIADVWGPSSQESGEVTAADVAAALQRASDLAYGAVATPREGTVLTVARESAAAAVECAAGGGTDAEVALSELVRTTVAAARESLARTPELLEVLRDAGVVDSGGKGYLVLLQALEEVVTGEHRVELIDPRAARPRPANPTADVESHTVTYGGPAYEVMFLLETTDDDLVPEMKHTLAGLGDSLVVVGGAGLWNVHVHVDDIGAAIEAGIAAGRPYRIKVTHLELADGVGVDERQGGPASRSSNRDAARRGRGLVAVSHGPGVAALLAESGVTTVAARPGRRPSTAELLDGIVRSGAKEVVLLPSDGDTRIVAEAAAEQARNDGVRVAVIPTRSIVQTLAAVAVHDSGAHFDDDLVAMGRSSASTRYGAVTVAVRQAMTSAGVCQVGDVLGLIDGDIAEIEPTLEAASIAVVNRLLERGGELLTIVAGQDANEELLDAVTNAVESTRPDVEVEIVDGGQPLWPLIVGVE